MSYHYHEIQCPYCMAVRGRGCNLDNCTTAIVSLEPFISSDGYEAEQKHCTETGEVFYVDYGDRPMKEAEQ